MSTADDATDHATDRGAGRGGQTRAERRQRIRDALSLAAVTLFCARGFDEVSVAEIAATAQVSKPTLFAYFPAKEDLVLHLIGDHRGEAARIVRARPDGTAPLTALCDHALAGLAHREPVTGLNDSPDVLAFHAMIFSTPSLLGRLAQYTADDERALAAALADAAPAAGTLCARLAAAQVLAVHRVLARENWSRLSDGETATARHPTAITVTQNAFAALCRALPAYA